MDGKVQLLSSQTKYSSTELTVDLAKVETPDGKASTRHLINLESFDSVAVLCSNSEGKVLLTRHFLFATQMWTWQIPVGKPKTVETFSKTALRTLEEQTGYSAMGPKKIASYAVAGELTSLVEHVVLVLEKSWIGPGRDNSQSGDNCWFDLRDLKGLMSKGEITHPGTIIGIQHLLLSGDLRILSESPEQP